MTTTQDPNTRPSNLTMYFTRDKRSLIYARYHKTQAHSFKVFAFNYICKSRSNYNCCYSSTHHERTHHINDTPEKNKKKRKKKNDRNAPKSY